MKKTIALNPKFDTNDVVYTMYLNRILCGTVEEIKAKIIPVHEDALSSKKKKSPVYDITYSYVIRCHTDNYDLNTLRIREHLLFSSKDILLKSLLDNFNGSGQDGNI